MKMIEDLMFLLADEAEAVKGYLAVLKNNTDETVKAVLTEIINDEYNHIGRLTALVSSLDREAGEKIAKGIEGEE
jgi:rubrerythrin